MKLALIFAGTFFGAIALIAGAVALAKALANFMDWLKARSGRSDTQITMAVMCVFYALVIAGTVTAVIAFGGKQ